MTAFVAVCLTLAGPSVFKISKSFCAWLIRLFGWLEAEWPANDSEPNLSSSQTPGTQKLLVRGVGNYGTTRSSETNGKVAEPNSSSDLHAQTKPPGEHSISSKNGGPSNPSSDHPSDNSLSQASKDGKRKAAEPRRGTKDNPQDTAPNTNLMSDISSSLRAPEDLERQQSAHRVQGPGEALLNSNSSREMAWEFVRYVVHGGAKLYTSETLSMVVITTILFGLFVAYIVAGIFSAKIASDMAALSTSTSCGIWTFDTKAGDEDTYRNDLNNQQKEARASQYARNCYNSPDPTDSLGCNLFYNKSIAFTTKSYQTCPFESPELCLNGLYSATTFDTGCVDASIVGINSPVTHKFRRKTSCSPLNMTYPYVQKWPSKDSNDSGYRYYYGPTDNAKFTFETFGNPFEWLFSGYSVT